MAVAVKDVMEPFSIFEIGREPLHGAIFAKTCNIAEHRFRWGLEEAIQRDDGIATSLSIFDNVKFNHCLMNHAECEPYCTALTVSNLVDCCFAASLTVCFRMDVFTR